MAKCGCATGGCACNIQEGQGINVTGIGTADDPFRIESELARLNQAIEFQDTATLDFTVLGTGTPADKMIVKADVKLQPFPVYLTGGRPSAVASGKGAYYYDDTLHKPCWSDGAVWRDAAGTAV